LINAVFLGNIVCPEGTCPPLLQMAGYGGGAPWPWV